MLAAALDATFFKTTERRSETIYTQCCAFDLCLFIVVKEQGTSHFLQIYAMFELRYRTSFSYLEVERESLDGSMQRLPVTRTQTY